MSESISHAELSVLAGVMSSNGERLDDLTLTGDDFADGRYGDIFDTARKIRAQGKPVDPITIGEIHPEHEAFLWSALRDTPHSLTTSAHAEIVHEASVRRRVLIAGQRITEWANVEQLSELTDKARKELDDAFGMQRRKVSFLGDTLDATIASIGQPTRSVPTPWGVLDQAIGGFRPGALYVVGARPGVGKTVVGLQCAEALAAHGAVAYSSLEMGERELQLRLMSSGAQVAHRFLDTDQPLRPEHAAKVAAWRERSPDSISVDDRGSVTISDIRASVRSVARAGNLSGIVVDYLQLIGGAAGEDRMRIVTEASRQLKLMARDFDVPVIALSQLNRNAESRQDKRPAIGDLRESGAIEQDADVVMLLHRDMEPRADADNEFDILVAKNRQGSTGVLQLEWHGEFMAVLEQGAAYAWGK